MGYYIGFIGLAFGILVPLPQIIKIIRTRQTRDVSVTTYLLLVCAMTAYLIHAIYIKSLVFTIAQAVNLTTNMVVLALLIWRRK